MKHVLQSCSALLLFCAVTAHAQLYKWTAPDGRITYGDTPPPPTAARIEKKSLTIGGVSADDFPFELSEAMKNSPVTLFTTRNCIPCDDGRKMLAERGVPFTEKTVNSNEDIAQFRQAGGDGQLPLLKVGRLQERGFEPGAWNSALTSAGYPESSKLPKTYRSPVAEPAAPPPESASAKQNGSTNGGNLPVAPSATELPPAIGNAPPGFRF